MLFTYMTYSAYELYVALLDALISVAVALSVVVSLDRVFHVMKYMQLKTRSRVTGRKPEDYFQFSQLPGGAPSHRGITFMCLSALHCMYTQHKAGPQPHVSSGGRRSGGVWRIVSSLRHPATHVQ